MCRTLPAMTLPTALSQGASRLRVQVTTAIDSVTLFRGLKASIKVCRVSGSLRCTKRIVHAQLTSELMTPGQWGRPAENAVLRLQQLPDY